MAIEKGDLVYIHQTCCSVRDSKLVGLHFTVAGTIGPVSFISSNPRFCTCGWSRMDTKVLSADLLDGTPFWAPLSWIRKVPPLSELEGRKDARDIPVPVGTIIEA